MCQRIGRPPISTIGLGRTIVSSERRVPTPPARMTAFIVWMSAPLVAASREAEVLAPNFPPQYNPLSFLPLSAPRHRTSSRKEYLSLAGFGQFHQKVLRKRRIAAQGIHHTKNVERFVRKRHSGISSSSSQDLL